MQSEVTKPSNLYRFMNWKTMDCGKLILMNAKVQYLYTHLTSPDRHLIVGGVSEILAISTKLAAELENSWSCSGQVSKPTSKGVDCCGDVCCLLRLPSNSSWARICCGLFGSGQPCLA